MPGSTAFSPVFSSFSTSTLPISRSSVQDSGRLTIAAEGAAAHRPALRQHRPDGVHHRALASALGAGDQQAADPRVDHVGQVGRLQPVLAGDGREGKALARGIAHDGIIVGFDPWVNRKMTETGTGEKYHIF
ncbi:MAG: hypothetical protein MUF78_11255 [Candidatus Edwardsbacteria bacterium]|nr:hypothetical protein [Candidatus Edwardsbacteria bacterium]